MLERGEPGGYRAGQTAIRRPGNPHAFTSAGSMRTRAGHYNSNGFEQYDDVEKERVVLYVIQVVLQLLHRVFERRAVVIANLRPSGQSGFHTVTHRLIGYLAGELVNEVRAFGPRPNEAHVAAK